MASLMLIIVLAIVIQCVDGKHRIVQVSELSSDVDLFGNGEDYISPSCCFYGNCSCNSLDHAPAHLTNNVLINITTDLMLSSLIEVSNLVNVSIIGHNNPTVNCRKFGGINLTFCHNCIIQGIIWDGCGAKTVYAKTKAVLKISYSSNITIQNCSFQHSIGQAVILSEVSGDVNINHCQFVYNSYYRDHGAAVHYSSNNVTNQPESLLTITNCSFSYNKGFKSLVYLKNKISRNIIIHFSKFCHNQGVTSVYAINQRLSFKGELLFQNNTANRSAGMYIIDHSSISFDKDSNIAFIQNYGYKGVAVFLANHSTFLFDRNSKANFKYNKATNGIIYSEDYSKVIFTGNCEMIFYNNLATQHGAAISSFDNSQIEFSGKSKVTFNSNIVAHSRRLPPTAGGIIYSGIYSNVMFKGNSSMVFIHNNILMCVAICIQYS